MDWIKRFWGIMAVGLFVTPLYAETYILNNGGRLEGRKVSENADQIVIETGVGMVILSKKTDDPAGLLKIEPGRSAIDEYDERFAAIQDSRNAEDFAQLARWAKEKKLHRYVTSLMTKAIVLNPDHAEARKTLGYEKYEGRWMTKPELMAARGFVYYNSRWMTPAEKEITLGEEREADLRARIAREERLRLREEEKLRRQEELQRVQEMMQEAVMRRREPQHIDMPPWWWYYSYRDLFGTPVSTTTSTVPQTVTTVRNLYYPYAYSHTYYPYAANPYYGYTITTSQPITPAKSLQ